MGSLDGPDSLNTLLGTSLFAKQRMHGAASVNIVWMVTTANSSRSLTGSDPASLDDPWCDV